MERRGQQGEQDIDAPPGDIPSNLDSRAQCSHSAVKCRVFRVLRGNRRSIALPGEHVRAGHASFQVAEFRFVKATRYVVES